MRTSTEDCLWELRRSNGLKHAPVINRDQTLLLNPNKYENGLMHYYWQQIRIRPEVTEPIESKGYLYIRVLNELESQVTRKF